MDRIPEFILGLPIDFANVYIALLRLIANRRSDVELIGVLRSPVVGLSADDLAQIRGGNRHCSIFEALIDDKSERTRHFLDILSALRQDARTKPIAQLLEGIFALTDMDAIFAAMDDGALRQANLQAFYQLAVDY